ncbi:MAG: hypothetical protein U0931_14995 [Vulcanimicrobiota bacterium]
MRIEEVFWFVISAGTPTLLFLMGGGWGSVAIPFLIAIASLLTGGRIKSDFLRDFLFGMWLMGGCANAVMLVVLWSSYSTVPTSEHLAMSSGFSVGLFLHLCYVLRRSLKV